GPDARPALEPVGRAPGAQHRLLHGVVSFETRAQHAVAVAGEFPAVLLQVVRAKLGSSSRRHSSPPYVAPLTFSVPRARPAPFRTGSSAPVQPPGTAVHPLTRACAVPRSRRPWPARAAPAAGPARRPGSRTCAPRPAAPAGNPRHRRSARRRP